MGLFIVKNIYPEQDEDQPHREKYDLHDEFPKIIHFVFVSFSFKPMVIITQKINNCKRVKYVI